MPIGVPTSVPSTVIISEPTMALDRPPPEPGERVTFVNSDRLMPARPFDSRTMTIQARKARPNAEAA